MTRLVEVTLIIGYLSIVFLLIRSMVAIDRGLKARQLRVKEIESFECGPEGYSARPISH